MVARPPFWTEYFNSTALQINTHTYIYIGMGIVKVLTVLLLLSILLIGPVL